MKNPIVTHKEFEIATTDMERLLVKASNNGGFSCLSKQEEEKLHNLNNIVYSYEQYYYKIPMPTNLKELITLKMAENNIKQKDVARILKTTEPKLSAIINNKRKPSLLFLKNLREYFQIDGNFLLECC